MFGLLLVNRVWKRKPDSDKVVSPKTKKKLDLMVSCPLSPVSERKMLSSKSAIGSGYLWADDKYKPCWHVRLDVEK